MGNPMIDFSVSDRSLPPHHLVDDDDVGLDDLHDLGGDILIHIVGDGKTVVALFAEFYGGIDGLEKGLRVNTGNGQPNDRLFRL